MNRPLIAKYRADRHRERGVTMALVAISMVAIIAMAAMSIDLVTLYAAREEAQHAADAAALAAARVISISGMTADPANSSSSWQAICGGINSPATLAATAVANQGSVGGTTANVTVNYLARGTSAQDCSSLAAAFGVNPMVTVQIQRTGLPTFFSRIWGYSGNNVSATATAEAFNPSGSDTTGNNPNGAITPVRPSCVKPLMIPNQNPNGACPSGGCPPFVTIGGQIQNPGVRPTTGTAAVGSTFNLFADCRAGATCVRDVPDPQANGPMNLLTPPPPVGYPYIPYLPGQIAGASQAVPACGTSGAGGNPDYEGAIAGCDQTTIYQCGIPAASASPPGNIIDLSENPGGATGDTASGIACMLTGNATLPLSGQDVLDATVYPYRITGGSSNPAGLNSKLITSSASIVSLPIYDTTTGLAGAGNPTVTIVGFLQVFVNTVNPDGSLNVTVLNVAACGNGSSGSPNIPVTGTSPVPIRLITPP